MRSPIPDYLIEALAGVKPDTSGATAGYIPEHASADPEHLGAVFATVDGEVYGAGDVDDEFTIQSISKPFTYALALADRGFGLVLDRVGVEPSGEAFNELSLEGGSGRPLNPMINVGAITTHSLVGSEGAARRSDLSVWSGGSRPSPAAGWRSTIPCTRPRWSTPIETSRSGTCSAVTTSSPRTRSPSWRATPASARCSSPPAISP